MLKKSTYVHPKPFVHDDLQIIEKHFHFFWAGWFISFSFFLTRQFLLGSSSLLLLKVTSDLLLESKTEVSIDWIDKTHFQKSFLVCFPQIQHQILFFLFDQDS